MFCERSTGRLIGHRASAVAVAVLAVATPASAQVPEIAWSSSSAQALLTAVDAALAEGLDPARYGRAELAWAIASNSPDRLNRAATATALALASDYRFGRVAPADRIDWHIGDAPDRAMLLPLIREAAATGRVAEMLATLLPQNAEYKALKTALAETPANDAARRTKLRVNLERWRWMPRELGTRFVFVNIPAYRVEIIRDGQVTAAHEAIVGKPATPTPAFATRIEGAVINPGWAVPPSLRAEKLRFVKRNAAKAKRMGYQVNWHGPEFAIFQRPGPQNALGRIKLLMPNRWDIYLHDTPDKQLFTRQARALSAGCVRVKHPLEFAASVLASEGGTDDTWNVSRLENAVDARATVRAEAAEPVPVYIAYFTADLGADGKVELLGDPYGRDARIARALDRA